MATITEIFFLQDYVLAETGLTSPAEVSSVELTISGLVAPASVTFSTGDIIVNGTNQGNSATISNGDTFQLKIYTPTIDTLTKYYYDVDGTTLEWWVELYNTDNSQIESFSTFSSTGNIAIPESSTSPVSDVAIETESVSATTTGPVSEFESESSNTTTNEVETVSVSPTEKSFEKIDEGSDLVQSSDEIIPQTVIVAVTDSEVNDSALTILPSTQPKEESTKALLANAIEQIVEETKTSLIAAAEALSSSGISNVSQGEAPEEISDSDISDEVRREYIEPLPKEELQSLSEKLIVETIKEQISLQSFIEEVVVEASSNLNIGDTTDNEELQKSVIQGVQEVIETTVVPTIIEKITEELTQKVLTNLDDIVESKDTQFSELIETVASTQLKTLEETTLNELLNKVFSEDTDKLELSNVNFEDLSEIEEFFINFLFNEIEVSEGITLDITDTTLLEAINQLDIQGFVEKIQLATLDFATPEDIENILSIIFTSLSEDEDFLNFNLFETFEEFEKFVVENSTSILNLSGEEILDDASTNTTGSEDVVDESSTVITGDEQIQDEVSEKNTGQDEVEDESTTLITGGETGEDESTTLITGGETGEDESTTLVTGGETGEDESTTLVTGGETGEDESTTTNTGTDDGEDESTTLVTGTDTGEDESTTLVTGADTGEDESTTTNTGSDTGEDESTTTNTGSETGEDETGIGASSGEQLGEIGAEISPDENNGAASKGIIQLRDGTVTFYKLNPVPSTIELNTFVGPFVARDNSMWQIRL
jgi:hypothetical protein